MTLKLFVLCSGGNCGFQRPASRLNIDMLNGGVIVEVYNRVIGMAIETSFLFPFAQIQQTPMTFFLAAQIDAGDLHEQMGMQT